MTRDNKCSELEKLYTNLKADNVVAMHVTWGKDAPEDAESRAAILNEWEAAPKRPVTSIDGHLPKVRFDAAWNAAQQQEGE